MSSRRRRRSIRATVSGPRPRWRDSPLARCERLRPHRCARGAAGEQSADATVGQHFEQQRVGYAPVDDVGGGDAAFDGAQRAFRLRQHAAGQRAVGDEARGVFAAQAGERPAFGVEDAGGVGEQHQLLRVQAFGHCAGHEVRVDVVGLAVRADPDRRDDGDEAGVDERVEQAAIDGLHLADVADVDDFGRLLVGCRVFRRRCPAAPFELELAGADEIRVLAADPHRSAAGRVQQRDDVLVDEAAEHHLHHVHRRRVGHPHAVNEARGNVEAVEQFPDLRAAAMHDDGIHAHQLEQHHVAGEGAFQVFRHHRVAAVLDDDGRAVELPNVGQRLGEDAGDPGVFVHHRHDAAVPPGAGWKPSAPSMRRRAASKVCWMRPRAAWSSASKRSVSAGLVFDGRTSPQPSS